MCCRRMWDWGLMTCAVSGVLSVVAAGEDWPQWRGPRGDGISRESGLLGSWPQGGPPELWRTPLGEGFSSVSVVGDRAFTMCGGPEGESVVCVAVADGKVLWKTRSGDLFESSYGNGPRATPTIDEGRVYTLGASGSLLCLDADRGAKIWGCNVFERFGGTNVEFGLSASPVVSGRMVIAVTGSGNGKSLLALDKTNGDVLWTALDDKAGYSTPIFIEVDGMPQIVVLMGEAVVGVSPSDGKELWRYPWTTTLDANVATPIFFKNRLYVSTGYGTGCGMLELSAKDGKAETKLLWANKDMKNYFSTCVLVEGHLYGFNNTMLACMDFETGEVSWKQRGFNRGSVLAADGKLLIYGERATLALAEISPREYKEISRAEVLSDRTWTVPTVSGGRLFLRNEKDLACLSLQENRQAASPSHRGAPSSVAPK